MNKYWTTGQVKGLDANWSTKLRRIMLALDDASQPEDMNIPGWRFHALASKRHDVYSVRLTGNWRVTFQWDGKDAIVVDIEDYH